MPYLIILAVVVVSLVLVTGAQVRRTYWSAPRAEFAKAARADSAALEPIKSEKDGGKI